MSDKLPNGWARAPLAELITHYQAGFASGEKNIPDGVAHLRMNNIGLRGELVLDLVRTVPKELAKPHHQLSRGDVLVCTTNSGKLVGKCAYFDLEGRYAFSNHLTRLRPDSHVLDGRFLRWNLWLQWHRGEFEDKCKHWVNQSTLPKEALLELDLVVPPLREQRAIIAKLEKLLAKVDACRKRLDKIPKLLKRFRQAVLSAACSGRLTADWRHEQQLECDWPCRKLGEIGTVTGGVTKNARRQSLILQVPYLRVANVYENRLELSKVLQFGVTEAELERARLVKYDLLFVEGNGSLDQIGRVALWDGSIYPCVHQNHLIKFRAGKSVRPYYVLLQMMSPEGRAQLTEKATSSAGLNTLSISKISDVNLPIPSVCEQEEIVRRVKQQFALADEIEARYEKAKAHVQKLTQSILAKAFRGELVPQDPRDEPAERLLERIRQERSSIGDSRRRTRCASSGHPRQSV